MLVLWSSLVIDSVQWRDRTAHVHSITTVFRKLHKLLLVIQNDFPMYSRELIDPIELMVRSCVRSCGWPGIYCSDNQAMLKEAEFSAGVVPWTFTHNLPSSAFSFERTSCILSLFFRVQGKLRPLRRVPDKTEEFIKHRRGSAHLRS